MSFLKREEALANKKAQAIKISKPPGGDTSDIFTTPNSTPPSTPRKVKNYMASNIFTPADAEVRSVRQRPDDSSFTKLFGTTNGTADTPDGGSPRGKNYQKSNVLFPQANGSANGHVNGKSAHNGDSHENGSNGTASGSSSGSATPSGSICGDIEHPKTNGTSNGVASTNGSTTNGSATNGVNGAVNGTTKPAATNSKRIPPGGFSSKLW